MVKEGEVKYALTSDGPFAKKSLRSPGRPKGSTCAVRLKDKHAPKGPRSAYLHFLSARRDSYSREHKGVKYSEVLAAVAVEWSQLPDEQKKKYFEKAQEDRERYNREFRDYQKTNMYREFEAKKKKFVPENKSKLRTMCTENVVEEEASSSVLKPGDIRIFSDAFLEYNKAQERKLRETRRNISNMHEEESLLKKEIARLEENLVALRQRKLDSGTAQKCYQVKAKWEKLLSNVFSGISLPGLGATNKSVDSYMSRLHEIVSKNPNDVVLNSVRSALVHVDFTIS